MDHIHNATEGIEITAISVVERIKKYVNQTRIVHITKLSDIIALPETAASAAEIWRKRPALQGGDARGIGLRNVKAIVAHSA